MIFTIRLERILVFLLIAGIVAIITRKFRVPYSIGLVFTGVILALHPFFSDIPISKELIFNVFLPPLVFEAALQIHWRELRKDLPVVVLLATIGVCLSWFVTALGMRYIVGWEWISALFFGILIAATDPVSVIATFKEAGVQGRLRLLVESESLLNDGTAAVGFGVILSIAGGGSLTLSGITIALISSIAGGIICGVIVAGIIIVLVRLTSDHLVEMVFTTFAAYSSFLLAEHFHFSGVLAALTAGLIIGELGKLKALPPDGRKAVDAYWEFVGFLVNSIIFLAIGIHLSNQNFSGALLPSIIAVLLVILGRAFAVYTCCAAFARSELRVENRHQHVLFWGGLRGALALALAVGLPPSLANREIIISVTFAVVAFSIFVQGLTMTPLLRRLGEIPGGESKVEK